MTSNIFLLFFILLVLAISGMRVGKPHERDVIFRFGRLHGQRGPGLYWMLPLKIERAMKVDMREQTVAADHRGAITRDGVTIKLNAALSYRVADAEKALIEVHDAPAAVYGLVLDVLHGTIGQHSLEEVLQHTDRINEQLRRKIAGPMSAWGLYVQSFEIKPVGDSAAEAPRRPP
jgi:regulator of protease activity HflC (stomatin/prohibitin superfamily)